MKRFSTKNMVITALLIAFGIIIPTAFGFLRITLPPAFTATLTARSDFYRDVYFAAVRAAYGNRHGSRFLFLRYSARGCGSRGVAYSFCACRRVYDFKKMQYSALRSSYNAASRTVRGIGRIRLPRPRLDFRRRRHGLGNRLYNGYRNAYPPRS